MSDDERMVQAPSQSAKDSNEPDKRISLIDSTQSNASHRPQPSSAGSWTGIIKLPTSTSVRDSYNRRKYAKWKQGQLDDDQGEASDAVERQSSTTAPKVVKRDVEDQSEAVDFAGRQSTDEPQQEPPPAPHKKRRKHEKEAEVDILYENQRGAFFCGIPLYSHSSLLQFDPSAWVNKDYKDSAVNITNAQVPDPSWTWAWKSWHVDMGHDVDEEGWQYSFAFGANFSWHGNHPWFHSFVRRRRWLRKRVKRHDGYAHADKDESMDAAHHLTAEYFTIHSRQPGRPASVTGDNAVLPRNSSYSSLASMDEEPAPEDIRDIPSLQRAIRHATIDREKVDVIKQFVGNGGEELVYLPENLPQIMCSFVFQSSRRQVLEFLRQSAADAQQHREKHEADDRAEGDVEKRHIDNLLKAADVANSEIGGLEYWSDRKHVLETTDEMKNGQHVDFTSPFDEKQSGPKLDEHPADDIRGISEKAEISKTPLVDRRLKGKEKAKDEEEQKEAEDSKTEVEQKESSKAIPQLGKDDVFIPDT